MINLEMLKFVIIIIGLISFVSSIGFAIYRAHTSKPPHMWLTIFTSALSIGLIALGMGRSFKVGGEEAIIEVTAEQMVPLAKLEKSLASDNLQQAKIDFTDFKNKLISESKFPGISKGLMDTLTLDQYLEIKKTNLSQPEDLKNLIEKNNHFIN